MHGERKIEKEEKEENYLRVEVKGTVAANDNPHGKASADMRFTAG